ncbi:MAG: hypothetical protein WC082_14240 [Victivallales bacterium]
MKANDRIDQPGKSQNFFGRSNFFKLNNYALLTIICILACFISKAEQTIDVNGGFEKVKSEPDGKLIPEYWLKNKGLKSTGEVKVIWGEDNVKNGKFALEIVTSETSLHIFNRQSIKVQTDDEFTITIAVKGKGTFGIFFYNHGTNGFLGTTASKTGSGKSYVSIDSEEWLDEKFCFKIRKVKKMFPASITLCIVVNANSKVSFDDLQISRKTDEKKADK